MISLENNFVRKEPPCTVNERDVLDLFTIILASDMFKNLDVTAASSVHISNALCSITQRCLIALKAQFVIDKSSICFIIALCGSVSLLSSWDRSFSSEIVDVLVGCLSNMAVNGCSGFADSSSVVHAILSVILLDVNSFHLSSQSRQLDVYDLFF